MTEGKQVTIARHSYFYERFFETFEKSIETFVNMSVDQLNEGYTMLDLFYKKYSYYLKQDDLDTYLRDKCNDKRRQYIEDSEYSVLVSKMERHGLKGLVFKELCRVNELYNSHVINMLEVFESFCERLGKNDILPNLSKAEMEYERSIGYVIYDKFYLTLSNVQEKIGIGLLNFNVLHFIDLFQVIAVYFYSYSYYLQRDTVVEIKKDLDKLYGYYNNKEFLTIYFKYVHNNYTNNDREKMGKYIDNMFELSSGIYEKINGDMPKTNIMPKRQEKVMRDETLI